MPARYFLNLNYLCYQMKYFYVNESDLQDWLTSVAFLVSVGRMEHPSTESCQNKESSSTQLPLP
ncbi:unnamed protein product [Ixodes pacificus]